MKGVVVSGKVSLVTDLPDRKEQRRERVYTTISLVCHGGFARVGPNPSSGHLAMDVLHGRIRQVPLAMKVLLKDFKQYAEGITDRVRRAT